jgi:cytochrome c biogenesis protein CcmG, thiol:disulfide interchange protein DsbE
MTERRELAAKLTLLGFVALFVIFFSRPHGTRIPKLGELAPAFALQKDDGRPLRLGDYRGKIVVLNFWATWCPPCIDEMPSLNRFAERYAEKGVQVLGVSVDEDPDAYRSFLAKNKISFLTLRNPSRTVSESYGTYKLPESFIISRDGHLLQKVIGAANWTDSQMISYMDSLVPGS